MTEIIIDRTQALNLLSDIVEDKGEDHEAYGMYATIDTVIPVCIIGHVFDRLGILREVLSSDPSAVYRPIDRMVRDHSQVYGDSLAYRIPTTEVLITADALMVLTRAQREQDRGVSWGDALSRAKAEKVMPV